MMACIHACMHIMMVPVAPASVHERHKLTLHCPRPLAQVLFPAMKASLRVPRPRATDGTFVQVAALEKLYRIFERC